MVLRKKVKPVSEHFLFSKSIFWQKHPSARRFFYAINDGKVLLLRLNNFPEEPLYTFISELEIIDFDDAPSLWVIDY